MPVLQEMDLQKWDAPDDQKIDWLSNSTQKAAVPPSSQPGKVST
jgi:hypothetical protein